VVAPPAIDHGDHILEPRASAHARQPNGGPLRGGGGKGSQGVQARSGVSEPELGRESQQTGVPGERRPLIARGLFVEQGQACLECLWERKSNNTRRVLSPGQRPPD